MGVYIQSEHCGTCSVAIFEQERNLTIANMSWPKVEDWNEETIFCGHYRFILNQL